MSFTQLRTSSGVGWEVCLEPLCNSLEMVIKAIVVEEILGSESVKTRGPGLRSEQHCHLKISFYFVTLTNSAKIVQRSCVLSNSNATIFKED